MKEVAVPLGIGASLFIVPGTLFEGSLLAFWVGAIFKY
jgi:hypothetical protein